MRNHPRLPRHGGEVAEEGGVEMSEWKTYKVSVGDGFYRSLVVIGILSAVTARVFVKSLRLIVKTENKPG